jgi:glucose/arabinose dehydrogenase
VRWVFLIVVYLIFCNNYAVAQVYNTKFYDIKLSIVADNLSHPWGMDFLPSGIIIVTERNKGSIRIIEKNGVIRPQLSGLPKVYISGQGGMLDVKIDPDFLLNKKIYFSYVESTSGISGTVVAVAQLNLLQNSISNLKVIFRQFPKTHGGRHYGSRIVFSPKGHLYITIGERGERDKTQDFTINRGQVIRVNKNGSVPIDNPFINKKGYRPETWSVGHRNPQGAAIHPDSGKLWINEHGAQGGDELNVILPGRNYGWPIISYGVHYSGGKIGIGSYKDGMEQPIYYWDPSIAPSGLAFYTGQVFPKWKGDAFVGALKSKLLVRLTLKGEKVISEEHILGSLNERIRTVINGPDGNLYILVDNDPGKIYKIKRVK